MNSTVNFKRANSEILEIIKYLPLKEQKMIPQERIEYYEKNKDQFYNFNYNPAKTLIEQNVLRETKTLIVALFRDVFATEEQKEKLKIILAQNEKKYQEELRKKYSKKELFKQKTKNIEEVVEENYNNSQIVVYKENIFTKIRSFIKRFLRESK